MGYILDRFWAEQASGLQHCLVEELVFFGIHGVVIEGAISHAKSSLVIDEPKDGIIINCKIMNRLVRPDMVLNSVFMKIGTLLVIGDSETNNSTKCR